MHGMARGAVGLARFRHRAAQIPIHILLLIQLRAAVRPQRLRSGRKGEVVRQGIARPVGGREVETIG